MSIVSELEGQSLEAVLHRGTHLQIIASAGSGKTEVVSQRVVSLIADGVMAREIVAFTFTERAAAELKNRISLRLGQRLGPKAVDKLSGLYVGTIHGYCFQLLQAHVGRYETYDVLDENQQVAFLVREAQHLGIKKLTVGGKLFESIEVFNNSIQVIENELLDPATMPEPFKEVLLKYYETIEKYRLLTFGLQIGRAVKELERPEVAQRVHAQLKHLIVDEYQDVNPAQERLIELLVGGGAHLCVVGDDDQAIYQWRGSNVKNIVEFTKRYDSVKEFELMVNRRSLPTIVLTADNFAKTIEARLDKEMKSFRDATETHSYPQVVSWSAETEQDEAKQIALGVQQLHSEGLAYKDIAILVRGRSAYPKIMEELATLAIPVQPGGRSGLFAQPEARVIGRMFCWLVDQEWREQYGRSGSVSTVDLLREFESTFSLNSARRNRIERWLTKLKGSVASKKRTASLVGEMYELLEYLEVREWDLSDVNSLNRMGTMARMNNLVADYEMVNRRARPDARIPGEQVGGQDRGEWYYRNLAIFIVNHAAGNFEGFEGEENFALDAVDLTTIHSAKGLEWPAVFLPSLTKKRFPSMYSGRAQNWLVPREMFEARRYEGGGDDERRLFYVAMTRARDWISISRHKRVTTASVQESPYFAEISRHFVEFEKIQFPALSGKEREDEPIAVSYSELAVFLDCGMAYRLRQTLGFMPELAAEIGYGKAVHHMMREVAEITLATGTPPDEATLNRMLAQEFFLPSANKVIHRELKDFARKLITTYIKEHTEDLKRVWETERPFELHLDGVTVSGRADVILDYENGVPNALTILDYKTASRDTGTHALQLQIYADAGRREGLDVTSAYVHDMKVSKRIPVDVSPEAIVKAEVTVRRAAAKLKIREFEPNPEQSRCQMCDVRSVCKSSAAK